MQERNPIRLLELMTTYLDNFDGILDEYVGKRGHLNQQLKEMVDSIYLTINDAEELEREQLLVDYEHNIELGFRGEENPYRPKLPFEEDDE
jgi:hypothetical protein